MEIEEITLLVYLVQTSLSMILMIYYCFSYIDMRNSPNFEGDESHRLGQKKYFARGRAGQGLVAQGNATQSRVG